MAALAGPQDIYTADADGVEARIRNVGAGAVRLLNEGEDDTEHFAELAAGEELPLRLMGRDVIRVSAVADSTVEVVAAGVRRP